MAEQNDPKTPQPEELEELSDESLDSIIKEADPEFVRELAGIAKERLSAVDIELRESDRLLFDERQLWQKGPRWKRILGRLLPFIPRLNLLKKQLWKLLNSTISKMILFLRSGVRGMLIKSKDGLKSFVVSFRTGLAARLKNVGASWEKLSRLRKFILVGLILATVGTGALVAALIQGKLKFEEAGLFLTSFDQVGEKILVAPTEKFEPFYDNLRVGSNLLQLPKMIVNLKPSKSSGPNPMGAFEFFIEGMTKEAIIELKDREIEVRDRLMRKIEEFSFDQVDTAIGKQNLSAGIQKELNAMLTSGRVKKVLIKTAIVKP